MNAQQAISQSARTSSAVRIDDADAWTYEDLGELIAESESSDDESYWGTDEDGNEWRVAVDHDSVLSAVRGADGWRVECHAGGVWWPEDPTAFDSAEAVLRACRDTPEVGEWRN